MTVVELARVEPQPWRNGGGVTYELLTWPRGEHWALRVSVAEIACDGPFSAFDGVERVFAVLTGAGVRLDWPARSVTLDADSPPLAFDGGMPPHSTLVGGTTRDLNLMLRRDQARGTLVRAARGAAWTSDAPWRGLLTLAAGRLVIDDGPQPLALPPWSLAFSADASGQSWRLGTQAPSAAYWIEARPR